MGKRKRRRAANNPAKKVGKKFLGKRAILFLICVLVLVLAVLVFLLALENRYLSLDSFGKKSERREFAIKDECSIIAGKLIHTIADEGVCKVRCKERCELLELNMESFNFTRAELNCHTCSCVCG